MLVTAVREAIAGRTTAYYLISTVTCIDLASTVWRDLGCGRLNPRAVELQPNSLHAYEYVVGVNWMAVTGLATLWRNKPWRSSSTKLRRWVWKVVGANNSRYTGMLSYYAEMIAARGLAAVIASNASPWVAPFGGTEGRFGANPFCLGFPSTSKPVIWDIGISEIIHVQAVLAQRQGHQLPHGVAYDSDGQPTTGPARAMAGALTAWGGHKGSGLGVSIQLLGMLAGSPFSRGSWKTSASLSSPCSPIC